MAGNIEEKIKEYFARREAFLLPEKFTFDPIDEIIPAVKEHYKFCWIDGRPYPASTLRIAPDSLSQPLETDEDLEAVVGTSRGFDRQRAYEELRAYTADVATHFFNHKIRPEQVTELNLKLNGISTPLEAHLQIGDKKKTIYLKWRDPDDAQRIIGAEIYALISGVRYNFAFNNGLVVEEQLPGMHKHEIPEKALKRIVSSEHFISQTARLESIVFFMGLGDVLENSNNYLIVTDGHETTPVKDEGTIYVIDFENLGIDFTYQDRESIKRNTALRLGVPREKFERLFEAEEAFIYKNVQNNLRALRQLGEIYTAILEENREEVNPEDIGLLRLFTPRAIPLAR